MSEYNIVYLVCDVLRTYTMFKLLSVFFDRTEINHLREVLSYLFYYVAVSFVYIFFNEPNITLTVNILSLFFVSLNYKATIQNRIFGITYTYTILMIIEFSVYWSFVLTGLDISNTKDNKFIIIQILITSISYAVSLIFSNIKTIRNSGEVPLLHWFAALTIPLITAILMLTPFFLDINIALPLLILIMITMFFVNILVFYLYDELLISSEKKLENALLLQQNSAYEKQLDVIYQSQENLKLIRHDLKNHLYTINSYINDNKCNAASIYIKNVFNEITNEAEYCKSGNFAIDSILNFKISQSEKSDIKTTVRVVVPEEIDVAAFDLNIIIGNLMDNAILAASKSNEKYIDISIRYEIDVLLIEINNSHNGDINERNGRLLSNRGDEHGLGLASVSRAIKKYNGDIKIDYDDKVFRVKLLIFTTKQNTN